MPERPRSYVLDTQILIEASKGDTDLSLEAVDLLNAIRRRHRLAVDDANKILEEYYRHLGRGSHGHTWLSAMFRENLLSYHPHRLSARRIRALDAIRFDPSDVKFVGVACRTFDKVLVAEEDDYWNHQSCRCLQSELGLTLLRIVDAAAHARAPAALP
jgi:hypothetical protein